MYDTLINNYIPRIDYLVPFIKDRAGLSTFLIEDSGEQDGNGKPLTRIELCEKLYKEYLEAKNAWNEEKNKKFDDLKTKDNGLDEYAKWQSSFALVRQEELNNLYNDVVVRGLLHEVLTILGYLNASSIAEQLEISKQKMRHSARVSLDESMTVYPVQFQPNNWFKALSPNLNPEDLTMAKDSIRDLYGAKQRELRRAKTELQQMELMTADPAAISQLEASIDAISKDLNQKEADLINSYGEGVVSIAKIYFNVMNVNGEIGSVVARKALQLGALDDSIVYMENLDKAVQEIKDTYQTQQTLNTAVSNLTDLKAKKAQLESRDWQFNKVNLQHRVNELQSDVDYYGGLVAGVFREAAKTSRIELERQYFADGELRYVLGTSPTTTGGSFKLKIGSMETDPINVSGLNAANIQAALQAVVIKANATTLSLESAFDDNTDKPTVTDLAGSTGYYEIKIKKLTKELNIAADETVLEPIIQVKEPAVLPTPQTEEEAEISSMFQDVLLKVTKASRRNKLNHCDY